MSGAFIAGCVVGFFAGLLTTALWVTFIDGLIKRDGQER